ncbi:MAG: rod shape-determining protein RodA [Rhodospirillales bacterium]|jgi:rod shape determining protein RodA|nr:rod shape-determining protein RodA [Rhodospirillales bacterium]
MSDRRLLRSVPFDTTAKLARLNWVFVLMICALAAVGYAALYSVDGGAPRPYAETQALRFALGLVLMLGVALVDIRFIARLAWPTYAAALALLVAVERFGHVGKGAQRWITIAGFDLQPSELMKVALVLALAAWFHRASWERVGQPLFLLVPLVAIAVPAALILKEPNLGTAVITTVVGLSVLFAAGVRWWMFAVPLLPLPLIARIAYGHLHGYQKARIETFLHPERDPLGAGYNIIQSKIALGSGGMWGQGYLHGTQAHLDFLPEKQTDFIFTIVGEEFGFMGALMVLLLLALIIAAGMLIGLRCRHQFGRLVAFGVTVNFFMYVFVNLAMVMGVIPVGGVPLPLVSYGGSALIAVMLGFGLLLSADLHRDAEFPADAGAL